jgi:hypothetical protein
MTYLVTLSTGNGKENVTVIATGVSMQQNMRL